MSQPTFSRWDLCRFLKTLAFFGAVPFLGSLPWLARTASNPVGDRGSEPPANTTKQGTVAIAAGAGKVAAALASSLTNQGYDAIALVGPQATVDAELRDRAQVASVDWSNVAALREVMPVGLRALVASSVPTTQSSKQMEEAQLASLLEAAVQRLGGANQRVLFDFSQGDAAIADVWGAIDDVVMGGVSQSTLQWQDGSAVFAGNVSTANSGGFASVRTRNFDPVLDLSDYEGIVLRLRGDGQRYKFFLRSETQWDGLAYSAAFDTVANTWMEVRLPFADFVPVFRAKTVNDAEPLARDRIRALQLMLSKFEYDGNLNPSFKAGPFRLELASIRTYSGQPTPQLIWISLPTPERDRAETQVRQARLPYTIIQVSDLTAEPCDRPLQLSQQHPTAGTASANQIANLCSRLLDQPSASYATVAALADGQDWQRQLKDLRPDDSFGDRHTTD